MFAHRRRLAIILICLFTLLLPLRAVADEAAKVYVILWFDTEDYVLPASDNATLRLARFLTRELIRAVFKVVGERARSFERRGRDDVIEALKKHEIGFHSHWHSVHPTPAMYLSTLGWDDGIAEFDRRERPGYDDVKRIFGVAPSCYGQPGSSWGPQSYGAMKKWGMPVYLDAGNHLNLNDGPCWYSGVLNLYKLEYTLRADLTDLDKLPQAEERFARARKKILAEGGGIVSIFYHPCEFVHKQFWDGVNFSKGANPPREQWKEPPMKTEEEQRIAWEVFERYIRFIKKFPEVEFINATEAARLYRDRAQGRAFDAKELKAIAAAVGDNISFQRRGDHCLAASEVFALLNERLLQRAGMDRSATVTLRGTPDGPANPTLDMKEPVTVDWSQFTRTAQDVQDILDKQKRVPTTVWLGSTGVTPESYLGTLARAVVELEDGKVAPKTLTFQPAQLSAADYVAADNPRLWGWVIFPPGFRAPAMMALAKRQAWTLKPALLDRAYRRAENK
jgi:hypothetical protein